MSVVFFHNSGHLIPRGIASSIPSLSPNYEPESRTNFTQRPNFQFTVPWRLGPLAREIGFSRGDSR